MKLHTPPKPNPLKNQSWLNLSKEQQKPIIAAAQALLTAQKNAEPDLNIMFSPEGYIPQDGAIHRAEEKLNEAIFKAIPLTFDITQGISYTKHLSMMNMLNAGFTNAGGSAFPDVNLRLTQINAIKQAALDYAKNPSLGVSR